MAISPFRVSIFPSLLTTEAERDFREASRSFCELPCPGDSASFSRPLLSLDKLVLQLPSLALRWQGGALHKPRHSMSGCLTRSAFYKRKRRTLPTHTRLRAR